MQNSEWVVLFRRIPPHQHDNLTLVTTTGLDISLQNILRLEENYLVIRGRIGGTTETGRIAIIPYDQLNYVLFTRGISEADLRAMHGESSADGPTVTMDLSQGGTAASPERDRMPPEPHQPAAATPASPLPAGAAAQTPPPAVPPPSRPNLVDRLRSRHQPPKPPAKE